MARVCVVLLSLLIMADVTLSADEGDDIDNDPASQLDTSLQWDVLDADDACQRRAEARYNYLSTGFKHDLFEQKEAWGAELEALAQTSAKYRHNRTVSRPDLVRKLQLVSYVGEALLPQHQRDMIVTFMPELEHRLKTGLVKCGENCSLDLSGVEARLAEVRDVEELRTLWLHWHHLFSSLQEDYLAVLQLTPDIATENENPDTESYWLMQTEFPGTYKEAQALWRDVEPLYLKLLRYVRSRLECRYGGGSLGNDSTTPPYLLGSLETLDWSNIADIVLGEEDLVYSALQKNLRLQELGGRKAYELAEKLVQSMGFEGLGKEFWEESKFNISCHTEVIEYCSLAKTTVLTCERASWPHFLEAHEVVMKAVRRQLISSQPYIFMNPNRQSAAHEAATGLLPLLAASTDNLQQLGLLPTDVAASSSAAISLQLLVALRTLPRLPYYLAADLWRLELLSAGNDTVDAANLWSLYKQNYSRVGSPSNDTWWDFVPDELMAVNKPYLAKFVGTILQFQMLELFENKTLNGSTVVKTIQEGDQLKQLLKDGLSVEWPALLRADLGIDRVDAGALTRYFASLEHFLDSQENASRPASNRGGPEAGTNVPPGPEYNATGSEYNATVHAGGNASADQRASSIGSGILIGCVTVAIIGIVATVFLVARRRFKRTRSDYQLAKTSAE